MLGSVNRALSRGLRGATAVVMVSALLALMPSTAGAVTGDLLISEYIEGSSFNKAIEIYNGTGAAVDLSTYTLELYTNGSPAVSQSVTLSGTVADGDVYVLSHGSANGAIQAQTDLTNSAVMNFNGDDGIVLRKAGAIVDSFGQVGVDPGSQWPGGGQNDTLVRKATVCAGDANFSDPFDASVEWDIFPQDDTIFLGAHTADCDGGGAALGIDCGSDLVTEEGTAASTTVSASDADDSVVSMTLVSNDVSPSGSLTAGTLAASTGVGDPATLELDLDAFADAGVYTATIQADNSAGETISCDLEIRVVGIVAIHDVQGSGAVSPLDGATVIIEGIVVGDFQDGSAGVNGDLNGFFVQEEDADVDADPSTSEGIFVFDGRSPAVDVANGDLVRVQGPVSEFQGLTEITSFSGVSILSSDNAAPTPASLSLPVDAVNDFEASEGMAVTFAQDLVISEYFNFDRFNETVLTSQRNLTPTAEVEPGAAALAEAENYQLDRITLDDGRTNQNPNPAIHPNGEVFDLSNLFRGGDTVANVTGVMHYAFGLYRIQPTQGADYTSVNPRTASPDPVGGRLQVATFNVLNYFTTLDNAGRICGPAGDQGCRGADNAEELTRQRAKIVAAIAAIDADVVGLIEIENNATDGPTADLVSGLNDAVGAGTYNYVATGAIGTDAIRTAFIYKPATVTPSGAFAVLDSSADPLFDDTRNRPVLAQTFVENATTSVFTVAVNHFKSKGSGCGTGDDATDGSGNCNGTRTDAATALVNWLADDPTGSGDADFLIVGDLNSYDKEAPIDVLTDAGYTDLIFDQLGEDAYSYVFDGQIGYLDYQLANAPLAAQVTGTTVWHINADEPDLIDYDTSFKQPAQDAIYAPDPYRSSDHDPVIVGLDLTTPNSLKQDARDDLASALPTGDSKDDKGIQKAIDRIDQSLNPGWWTGLATLHLTDGKQVFDREHQAVVELEKVNNPLAQTAIDRLLLADDILATIQLDIAIANGGDPKDIAKAQGNLDDAAANVTSGDYAKAILDYRKAWTNAVKAL